MFDKCKTLRISSSKTFKLYGILLLILMMAVTMGCIFVKPLLGNARIDVGGYKLFINSEGKGHPTVVFDTGYADAAKDSWNLVAPEVAKFTNVVTYDRAGLGQSDKSPRARTTEVMVEELHTLLQKAHIKGPYILVGHSFGGFNVRLFAAKYPKETAGLILVDTSHEDQDELLIEKMPAEVQEMYKGQFTVESSYVEMQICETQVREARPALKNVPLIVLSADNHGFPGDNPEEIWAQMQKDLASMSTKSKLVLATGSSHYIQKDQPQLVIQAIKDMMTMIKHK